VNAPHWVVQANLGAGSGLDALFEALQAQGVSYTAIDVIPFSDALPDVVIPTDQPVFFYGATQAVATAARLQRWTPGVFFNAEDFTYSAWARHYGAHLLNSPDETIQTTFRKALHLGLKWDGIFVRPERDLKEFTGAVWETPAFLRWARDIVTLDNTPQLHADTPIVIGEPHGIDAEWRTFVTGEGEVLGASQYRRRGRSVWDANVPDAVLAFAQARARQWSPAPVFVLDVAQSGGNLYVMEAQCIHSAGFYATPLQPLIQGINRTVMRWMSEQKTNLPAERSEARRLP
jgi:hypothetical protein